ncbi:MAG: VWA domain-containing protein [Burkholderiaceae bacterium]
MHDLDAPFDRLEVLPRELWLGGVVCSAGAMAPRLSGLHAWFTALREGLLPDIDANADCDFGDPAALRMMRAAVGELALPALCGAAPSLALQVLRTMLWHLDSIVDHQPAMERVAAIGEAARAFRSEWSEQQGDWEQMLALLQGLGDHAASSLDELRGMLRSREWREAQRISALLAHLQPLAELIHRLGRSEHHPSCQPAASARTLPDRHEAPQRERETHLPDAPGELKGIRLSGRLERMLGSEAAQIRHPVLHKLWRARLAESRLLTYESEAVLVEVVPDPDAPAPRAAQSAPQELEHGPMILCVDTSGSMRGAPENIAKAAVLEALRTAHRERRACKLIAFGAPGELLERDLNAAREGLSALLELMGQGFDGGTDVQTPIERAIELVHAQAWSSADLLLVSDGEFGCTPGTLARLDEARAQLGLRVQGILVGDRETMGLLEVCDEVFWLRDWRRFEGESPQREGFVPVHTASLTALYFPNALSARASRHAQR